MKWGVAGRPALTEALRRSVQFHAGADLLIVAGIFVTYGASP